MLKRIHVLGTSVLLSSLLMLTTQTFAEEIQPKSVEVNEEMVTTEIQPRTVERNDDANTEMQSIEFEEVTTNGDTETTVNEENSEALNTLVESQNDFISLMLVVIPFFFVAVISLVYLAVIKKKKKDTNQ